MSVVDAANQVLLQPTTIDEAIAAFVGGDARVLGGSTWFMRHRGEMISEGRLPPLIDISGVPALHRITVSTTSVDDTGEDRTTLHIGSAATHAEIATALEDSATVPFGALRLAAASSAFTQVRNVATIGGNIAARAFVEADLVPALVALDADLVVVNRQGARVVESIVDYLDRSAAATAELFIEAVVVCAGEHQRSGFARATVRGGAEYALVNCAVSVVQDGQQAVTDARLVVGAVSAAPTLCVGAADELTGGTVATRLMTAAAAAAQEVIAVDSDAAPTWYRRSQIPVVVAAALSAISANMFPDNAIEETDSQNGADRSTQGKQESDGL